MQIYNKFRYYFFTLKNFGPTRNKSASDELSRFTFQFFNSFCSCTRYIAHASLQVEKILFFDVKKVLG